MIMFVIFNFKYCKFLSFIVNVVKKMQVHYNVGENIVAYRTSHIGFVAIYVVVRIGGHFMNDDLSIVVLTSKVVGSPFLVSVSTPSTLVNTMNNMSPIAVFTYQNNAFVQIQTIGGFAIDLEDTF